LSESNKEEKKQQLEIGKLFEQSERMEQEDAHPLPGEKGVT
jgi:hypothetical protein